VWAYFLTLFLIGFIGSIWSQENMDALVAKTNFENLDYPIEKIIVRGFDGVNPPPRLKEPERPLFYGYGITAYFQTTDTLMFFKVQKMEAIHLNEEGEIIHTFKVKGSRYSESFKGYFMHLSLEEKKRIYFRNIYLKDKKGNFIKLKGNQIWCPQC
jgi:hypothetical protein